MSIVEETPIYSNSNRYSVHPRTGPYSIIDRLVPIYEATDKKLLKELLACDTTRWRRRVLCDGLIICGLLEDVSHRTGSAKMGWNEEVGE